MRQRRREADKTERDLPADEVADQLAAAAVGNMLDVEPARLLLAELTGEVLRRGGAGRAEGEAAGLALREPRSALERARLTRRMGHDEVRADDRVRNRREVLDRIVVQLLVDEGRDDVDVGVHDERVPVRAARAT